ncbi:MAG TPA: MFS transporter [Fibrobacteria bacterium]|nr:MFS transporter [Fibrobacteria bacterium]
MNKQKLFVASCLSLIAGSMLFAIRGDIEADLSQVFFLSKEQIGLIWGPAFWGFTLAIFVSGAVIDFVGMRFMHILSALGYVVGVGLVLFAPHPTAHMDSIFGSSGTTMLYIGFLVMGLSQGLVEGVVNPLIATLYHEDRIRKLNHMHAWWPGGMALGGIVAVVLTHLNVSWQVKLSTLLIPSVIYLYMAITQQYPKTERVASNVSAGEMFGQLFRPMFLLIFVCMWLTAATELGPNQWFPTILKDITGVQGVWFLILTSGLMCFLRLFTTNFVHKRFSPFAVLTLGSIVAFVGLYWLGSMHAGTPIIMAALASVVFTLGVAFFWPTMLGVTADLFPKGGALLISIVGGAGMLSIAVALPIMGARIDAMGAGNAGAALKLISNLPIVLFVVFGLVYLGYRAKGGYKAKGISEH